MIKLFIKRTGYFLVFSICFYIITYSILSHFYLKTNTKNSIFIYGDSQTVQGIDLKVLETKTGLNVYSAAKHGSGVYDFYYFAKSVPENSKIVLSISEHSQIRPDINEANTSPIDFNSLKKAFSLNYSLDGFENIIRRGIKLPHNYYFQTTQKLYPYNDSINLHTKLFVFKELYSKSTKEGIEHKQDMYLEGIRTLINKNCLITFIEFPYNKSLTILKKEYKINKKLNLFREKISQEFNQFKFDTILLKSDKNLMYDYTHLNEHGANILTLMVVNKINSANYFNNTNMLIVKPH